MAIAGGFALTLAACSDSPSPAATDTPPAPPPAAAAPATLPPAAEKQSVDGILAGRVKRALAGDAALARQGIEVTASEGTVSLWGTIDSEADRQRAASLAADVPGVTTVENRLVVVRGS